MAGAELSRPPEEITLFDVLQAVRAKDDFLIFDTPQHPNYECPIGGHILEAITEPFQKAQDALEDALAQYTISDVIEYIKSKM